MNIIYLRDFVTKRKGDPAASRCLFDAEDKPGTRNQRDDIVFNNIKLSSQFSKVIYMVAHMIRTWSLPSVRMWG